MSPNLMEKIVKDIANNRGKLVTENFDLIYTAHYNEIFLYSHLKEMFEIFKKYEMKTLLLSNGVLMTPDKFDIAMQYKDTVVVGICLTIPAFEKKPWHDWAMNIDESSPSYDNAYLWETLVHNLEYAYSLKYPISIQMNGTDMEELQNQLRIGKEKFPSWNIYLVNGLVDRAGLLIDHGIDNREQIMKRKVIASNTPFAFTKCVEDTKIVACENTVVSKGKGRPYDWLHINAAGKAFLCCDDFFMTYQFGDFNTQSLQDFWYSEEHIDMVEKAFEEGICQKCVHAVWE